MKAEGNTPRRFWVVGFVLLFALHAGAIVWFGERTKPTVPWSKPDPLMTLIGDGDTNTRQALLGAARDPMLFALPHPQGFSGGAWNRFRPEVPALSNWTTPPELLPMTEAELGKSLTDYVATNHAPAAALMAALRTTRPPGIRIPGEPIVTASTLRVEGTLAARLTRVPNLPGVVHTDLLRPTLVAISVNGDGLVESASLAGESGSKDADERALEVARQLAFRPLRLRDARARETTPPAIGRLIFTWQVLPATNGVPAAGR